MRRAILALSMLALAGSAEAAERIMDHTGLGPVKLGARERMAAAAVGHRFAPATPDDEPGCREVNLEGGREGHISYMIEDGRITRIGVGGPGEPTVRTSAGVRVGDSEADVRRAYGRRVQVAPDDYDDGTRHLFVQSPDRRGALNIHIEKGRVVSIDTGLYPSIRYIESCF